MIQVTLQFTSLAAAVKALKEIPESSVVSTAPAAAASTPLPTTEAAAPKPEKAAKAEKVTAGPTAAPAPAAATAPAAAAPTSAPAPAAETPASGDDEGELPYEVLQKAVFALAAKDRAAAGAINAQFGVKSMKELPVEKRRAALAAFEQALAKAA